MKIQPEWIEWKGGECPIDGKHPVTVTKRSGEVRNGYAGTFIWEWDVDGDDYGPYDIIAYCPLDIEPYKPKPKWTVEKDGGGGWILYCGNAYLYWGLHRESNAHRLADALNAAGVEL